MLFQMVAKLFSQTLTQPSSLRVVLFQMVAKLLNEQAAEHMSLRVVLFQMVAKLTGTMNIVWTKFESRVVSDGSKTAADDIAADDAFESRVVSDGSKTSYTRASAY